MTKLKFVRRSIVAGIFASAVTLALPSVASAAYAVQVLDDGVLQGGIGVVVSANSLIFFGSTTHFSITNGSGASDNPGTPSVANLDLSSNEQITTAFGATGGTHTIQIRLSQTDFTGPTGAFLSLTSSAGGSFAYAPGATPGASQTVIANYDGYFNNDNSLFGMQQGTPLQTATGTRTTVGTTSLVFNPATTTTTVVGPSPFSLTDVLTFTFVLDAGSGQTSANVSASTVVTPVPAVPEPASMTLFGTGLCGLAAAYRRRRAAK